MFFKKIRMLDILLLMMLSLFIFSLINTAVYNSNIKLVEKLSNNFYEEGTLIFSTEKQDYSFDEVYAVLPDNTALYAILQSLGQDIRVISYKGVYEPPLLRSGRFFSEEDFSGDKFLAVVGKDVNTYREQNGRKYILVGDCEYEVIGVMGYHMPTRLDNSIFLSANEDNFLLSDKYIVSSKDTQESYNFLGNEQLFGQVFARNYDGANILHIVDRKNNQLLLSILFLFILFINNVSIIHFWTEHKRRQIIIKIKNGYFNYQIILDICREFSFILLYSTMISSIASILFLAGIQKYEIQVTAFLFSIIFSVISLFICLIFFCIYILKTWKGERKI